MVAVAKSTLPPLGALFLSAANAAFTARACQEPRAWRCAMLPRIRALIAIAANRLFSRRSAGIRQAASGT